MLDLQVLRGLFQRSRSLAAGCFRQSVDTQVVIDYAISNQNSGRAPVSILMGSSPESVFPFLCRCSLPFPRRNGTASREPYNISTTFRIPDCSESPIDRPECIPADDKKERTQADAACLSVPDFSYFLFVLSDFAVFAPVFTEVCSGRFSSKMPRSRLFLRPRK